MDANIIILRYLKELLTVIQKLIEIFQCMFNLEINMNFCKVSTPTFLKSTNADDIVQTTRVHVSRYVLVPSNSTGIVVYPKK